MRWRGAQPLGLDAAFVPGMGNKFLARPMPMPMVTVGDKGQHMGLPCVQWRVGEVFAPQGFIPEHGIHAAKPASLVMHGLPRSDQGSLKTFSKGSVRRHPFSALRTQTM
jgi:hypothetical protein